MTTNAVEPARIMLTTDLSDNASCAFPHAMALASRHESELLLLHVITGYSDYAKENEQLRSYQEMIRAEAKARLDRLEIAGNDTVRMRRKLVTAWTAKDGIIAGAEAERPDLIVMSTHGHGPVARFFLGSVTRSVIAETACPVLCIKCAETGMLDESGGEIRMKHIMVPVDLSEESHASLKLAMEYARLYGARLHLMYVLHVDLPPDLLPGDQGRFFDLDEETIAAVYRRLGEFKEKVDPGNEKIITIVEKGSPAKKIASYAEAQAIDMIVLGRKGLGRAPQGFGSVAGHLLQEAPCPVLVI